MSDKRNRSQLRTEHPDEFTQKSCVEEICALERGVLEVRLDTGEFFEVGPTANEALKLPEAGDEVTLYLGYGPRSSGLIIGVDINGESVYYEPPEPDATPSPSEEDLALFNNIWAVWRSPTGQGFEMSQPVEASGTLHVPSDFAVDEWQRRRELTLGLNQMARALGMSHLTTLATVQTRTQEDHAPGPEEDTVSWEEKLAYLDSITPGWREAYRREFGREPDPEGVAWLIARETGGRQSSDI